MHRAGVMRKVDSGWHLVTVEALQPPKLIDSRLNLEVPDWDGTDTRLEPAVTGARTWVSLLCGQGQPTCPGTSGRSRCTTAPACLLPLRSLWVEPNRRSG